MTAVPGATMLTMPVAAPTVATPVFPEEYVMAPLLSTVGGTTAKDTSVNYVLDTAPPIKAPMVGAALLMTTLTFTEPAT